MLGRTGEIESSLLSLYLRSSLCSSRWIPSPIDRQRNEQMNSILFVRSVYPEATMADLKTALVWISWVSSIPLILRLNLIYHTNLGLFLGRWYMHSKWYRKGYVTDCLSVRSKPSILVAWTTKWRKSRPTDWKPSILYSKASLVR